MTDAPTPTDTPPEAAALDLERLEKLAKAAERHRDYAETPWETRIGDPDEDYAHRHCDVTGRDGYFCVASVNEQASRQVGEDYAAHIAAFDPPTVLALLAEVRAARQPAEPQVRSWEELKLSGGMDTLAEPQGSRAGGALEAELLLKARECAAEYYKKHGSTTAVQTILDGRADDWIAVQSALIALAYRPDQEAGRAGEGQ